MHTPSIKYPSNSLSSYESPFLFLDYQSQQFLLILTGQMNSTLSRDLQTLLTDLKNQNSQIDNTIKYLKRTKSIEITHRANTLPNCPEDKENCSAVKTKRKIETKTVKSKTFHRCQSCHVITNHQHPKEKQREKPKEKEKPKTKVAEKKLKPSASMLQAHKKASIYRASSPKKNLTVKYMGMIRARMTLKKS